MPITAPMPIGARKMTFFLMSLRKPDTAFIMPSYKPMTRAKMLPDKPGTTRAMPMNMPFMVFVMCMWVSFGGLGWWLLLCCVVTVVFPSMCIIVNVIPDILIAGFVSNNAVMI